MGLNGAEAVIMMGVVSTGSYMAIRITNAIARRLENRNAGAALPPALPTDLAERLERIEHTVESVAVEVERLAEGQRFTAKLLAKSAEDRMEERVGERGRGP